MIHPIHIFRIVITCMICCGIASASSQIITRTEPPNWWIGMKDSTVQIMYYGAGIGEYTPAIKSNNATLLGFHCPGNKNYLFVDISIHPNATQGFIAIDFKLARGGFIATSYPIQKRAANSPVRKGFTSQDVIYLITPDRFANGDMQNDKSGMREGINRADKNGRHGGDIKGVYDHLNYIANLGATALWLNPVLENNMDAWSYHGYAITDFYSVDPRMGTNEDFKELTSAAQARGIKMIMDMVHNHCGLHHWWMQDLPSDDWINYKDQPYQETNHRKTLHPDPYAAPGDLAILEDGWFVPSMPDLNVKNEFLANYLINNSLWWIEYAGLAGIRMDTYLYPESNFMSRWTKRVMDEYPNLNITGEVWFDQPDIVSYWQRGKQNADGYVSNLRSLFDFPIQSGLMKALNSDEDWDNGWIDLYETLAKDFQYPDPNNLVTFVDNHDMSRAYAQLNHDITHLKTALAFIMTMRGIPQLYYGTEILMDSPKTRDDGMVRSDFPGGWMGDTVNAFSGTGLSTEQQDMRSFVGKLLNWRKTSTVVHFGKTQHYVPEHGVYVLFRYSATDKLMVILNKNKEPYTLNLGRFSDMLASVEEAKNILTDEVIPLGETIALPGPGPYIFELR